MKEGGRLLLVQCSGGITPILISCLYYHGLEQVQLHPSLAISNCEFFETLYPFDDFQFGTKTQLNIVDGYVMAPVGEGLCIEYDWDFIDKHTVAVL